MVVVDLKGSVIVILSYQPQWQHIPPKANGGGGPPNPGLAIGGAITGIACPSAA